MAVSATNSYTGAGIAESFEDVIYDISPEETPLLSMAKKMTAGQTYHQWQTDALAAAAANRQLEGDDASYATLAATTVLGNYTQISRKTVNISNTYDVVKKYGRKSQVAYELMKAGKELKRDMEFALVRNQASSAGGAGTARSSAGLESWISGNSVKSTAASTATTPGFAAGVVAAPTDGTAGTFIEADLKSALELAWLDGGEPTTILMSSANKKLFSAFAGIAEKRHMVNGTSEAIITAAADVYVSDYGNHTVKLDRFMRDEAVLCVDPQYVGVASLRPITKEELAKTGDSTKYLMTAEYALVVNNPDAHAKVQGVGA
jgi:hypothetical protein